MGLNVRIKIFILGDTNEGRDLAELLVTNGHEVITSLAGWARRPTRITGEMRANSLDGANGLAVWLVDNGIGRMVDATHPFAKQIGTNTVAAYRSVGTPLLRISRPNWASHPLADTWTRAVFHDDASRKAARYERVLLTVDKQSLDHHRNLPNVMARMVELPGEPLPGSWRPLLERGPFTVDSGKEPLRDLGVDVLVTKDSGDPLTEAKLTAAANLGVRVIMMRRAPVPKDALQVAAPREAPAWVNEVPA